MSMRDNETGVLQKKRKNASIFDEHLEEIKCLLDFGLSILKTYEKILEKLPNNKTSSYNGFYRFCQRRGII